MNFIKKNNFLKNGKFVPEETGIFGFWKDDKQLYLGKSSNLRKTITSFIKRASDDKNIFELISQSDSISWETTSSLFSALAEEKIFLAENMSEFNQKIKLYLDYVYLGIDFRHVPYFKIEEDTQGEKFYVGAFRNRYFLYDFLDTMAELFHYPFCENEEFPCRRLKEKTCDGFCVENEKRISEIIMNSYLQPNPKIIAEISKKIDKSENNLQFAKAETLKKQRQIIEKYFLNLKFLLVCKNLDFRFQEGNETFHIKNGFLEKIETPKRIFTLSVPTIKYRKNELLAVDKSALDELWIVFRHLQQKAVKEIDRIYTKSISHFENSISG